MKTKIIQDYGKAVTPEIYMNVLQGHQYIPQADQCIKNILRKKFHNEFQVTTILDVGCGPGRISQELSLVKDTHIQVLGIDTSGEFINFAQSKNPSKRVSYLCSNFIHFDLRSYLSHSNVNQFFSREVSCIVMQSVMNHIHGEDRSKFLQRSFELLKSDGILIIGDEFIKDYESEEERILNVAKFYLHIIDEARKGGFDELAKEEAKNLIDDYFSGTKFAGHATEKTFEHIYQYAQTINEMFYSHGSVAGLNFDANNQIRNMFEYIKRSVESVVDSSDENFNRGDYKVSPNVFAEELSLYGFVLEEKYEIGPVKQLGGMGILVFMKR